MELQCLGAGQTHGWYFFRNKFCSRVLLFNPNPRLIIIPVDFGCGRERKGNFSEVEVGLTRFLILGTFGIDSEEAHTKKLSVPSSFLKRMIFVFFYQ